MSAVSTSLERFRRLGQAQRPLSPPRFRSLQSRWTEQFKQALLGLHQQDITAAAIIETPLRVQPDQKFTLRIHVMGRSKAGRAAHRRVADAKAGEISLSRLVTGEIVQIEVRTALQQDRVFLVQRACVSIPEEGYVAVVTVPMQSLASAPTGWRDRSCIFFMDEHCHPLYENPFAVEIFVSNHVKRGSEGHHVLAIPL